MSLAWDLGGHAVEIRMPGVPVVVGLDPGLANFGYAVVELRKSPRLVEVGLVRTEKSAAKRQVAASDDDVHRALELATELRRVLAGRRVVCLGHEAISLPRNASVAAKIGIAFGVMAAVAHELGAGVVGFSPQEVKRRTVGDKSASKADVMEGLRRFSAFENLYELLEATGLPKGAWEHPADAAAVALCALTSDVAKAALAAV